MADWPAPGIPGIAGSARVNVIHGQVRMNLPIQALLPGMILTDAPGGRVTAVICSQVDRLEMVVQTDTGLMTTRGVPCVNPDTNTWRVAEDGDCTDVIFTGTVCLVMVETRDGTHDMMRVEGTLVAALGHSFKAADDSEADWPLLFQCREQVLAALEESNTKTKDGIHLVGALAYDSHTGKVCGFTR